MNLGELLQQAGRHHEHAGLGLYKTKRCSDGVWVYGIRAGWDNDDVDIKIHIEHEDLSEALKILLDRIDECHVQLAEIARQPKALAESLLEVT